MRQLDDPPWIKFGPPNQTKQEIELEKFCEKYVGKKEAEYYEANSDSEANMGDFYFAWWNEAASIFFKELDEYKESLGDDLYF